MADLWCHVSVYYAELPTALSTLCINNIVYGSSRGTYLHRHDKVSHQCHPDQIALIV